MQRKTNNKFYYHTTHVLLRLPCHRLKTRPLEVLTASSKLASPRLDCSKCEGCILSQPSGLPTSCVAKETSLSPRIMFRCSFFFFFFSCVFQHVVCATETSRSFALRAVVKSQIECKKGERDYTVGETCGREVVATARNISPHRHLSF